MNQNLSKSIPENFNIANHPLETFLAHQQQPEFPVPTCIPNIFLSNKRKAVEQSTNISPDVSTSEFEGNTSTRKNNKLGNGKRGRRNEKESEKSSEVVHVRAKRGQATDSHSIAERIRREKINDKMKCLQDLVPGCHKAKGMALMLDEIINYVHSLQNQVEFLSMELAVACSSYGLKTQGTSTLVAQGMEKWVKGRYGEQNSLHSTWPF